MKREIGSSFYKLLKTDKEFQKLKESELELDQYFRLYSSGRSALLALFEEILNNNNNKVKTIWLPEYYCHNVLNFLKRNYANVKLYYINPFNYNNDFNFQCFAKKGDVIVLNNYFGLFEYNYNPKSKQRPIIIEDHSHAWLSRQSMSSKADYCICSVRKTYPIPGGGVTWKPNSNNQSDFYQGIQDESIEKGFYALSNSLEKKRAFLKEGEGNKEDYLSLLAEGESCITTSNSYIKPNNDLLKLLKTYIKLDPNKVKSKNLNFILPKLSKSSHFKILNRQGYAPFGLLLLFKEETIFNDFKSFCIKNNIYPANLWPNNDLRTQWKYFFNIHIDFRYGYDDMNYLVTIINDWIEQNP
jgi:signal peptidase I